MQSTSGGILDGLSLAA